MGRQKIAVSADYLAGMGSAEIRPLDLPAEVQHPDDLLQVMQVACGQVVASLRMVQGAAVTVHFRGSPVTLAHTDSWVRRYREQEDEQGDGPGLWALHTQHVVSLSRGELLARWPALADITGDTGVRAVHAVPLQVGQQPAGVLTLYSTGFNVIDLAPGQLAQVQVDLTNALTRYCAAHPHEDHAVRLERELHNRELLGHAVGILMAREQITEQQARDWLRARAENGPFSLIATARAIVRQHLSSASPAASRLSANNSQLDGPW